jgi:tRNA guanosine-2'-O-methyltransferase
MGVSQTKYTTLSALHHLLCKFIEQGAQSPRTMRLTALHITGLWLQYPTTAIFYVEQLKSLPLHRGEAVDEELDGELIESQVAAREYSMLIQSSDIEAFTNSEMYVRVTVAVMLHQFVLLVQVSQDSKVLAVAKSAATCGQMLLLELLNAAVSFVQFFSSFVYNVRNHLRGCEMTALL